MREHDEIPRAPQKIEILDAKGAPQAMIDTDRPDWSFSQYCRNRETAGWSWQISRDAA